LFKFVNGGTTEGLVCAGSAMTMAPVDSCDAFTGRAARLCHTFCAHASKGKLTASRLRLQRHFARLTGGGQMPCEAGT